MKSQLLTIRGLTEEKYQLDIPPQLEIPHKILTKKDGSRCLEICATLDDERVEYHEYHSYMALWSIEASRKTPFASKHPDEGGGLLESIMCTSLNPLVFF